MFIFRLSFRVCYLAYVLIYSGYFIANVVLFVAEVLLVDTVLLRAVFCQQTIFC